jgi:hypothetical protein
MKNYGMRVWMNMGCRGGISIQQVLRNVTEIHYAYPSPDGQ